MVQVVQVWPGVGSCETWLCAWQLAAYHCRTRFIWGHMSQCGEDVSWYDNLQPVSRPWFGAHVGVSTGAAAGPKAMATAWTMLGGLCRTEGSEVVGVGGGELRGYGIGCTNANCMDVREQHM